MINEENVKNAIKTVLADSPDNTMPALELMQSVIDLF